MNAWRAIPLLLLMAPWAGCLDDTTPLTRVGLFTFQLIDRGDPAPAPVRNCAALLEHFRGRALDEARVSLELSVDRDGYYSYGGDVVFAAEDGTAPQMAASGSGSGSGSGSASRAAVTGTNNQERGADEGDFVKTDGEWTYVLLDGVLHILHSQDVGDVEDYGRLDLGDGGTGDLLLEARTEDDAKDDRLVVVLSSQNSPVRPMLSDASAYRGSSPTTRVLVLSLADRSSPTILHERWIEGESRGARLVDGHAYVIIHQYAQPTGLATSAQPDEDFLARHGMDWDDYREMSLRAQKRVREKVALEADAENERLLGDLRLDDHVPTIVRKEGNRLTTEAAGESMCKRFYMTKDTTGRGVTTILALDVADARLASSTTQVLGGSPTVYASESALVLAAPSQDTWWFWVQPQLEEATDLQWFTLDGLTVRPKASGRVVGTVLDSFSLDVEKGQLRVATTTGTWGRWWMDDPEPMMSHVATFKAARGVLVPQGLVGGIAPGEKIWSARFTEDRAYLVTFRQTDPLWVIDLSGLKPRILGELEIPGVSTYIHPLDEDALLTIGYGPRPDGGGLDWGRLQVSLFDISDVNNPERADVLDVAPRDGWSSSAALHEHKAFTYWPEVGTLAVPLSTSNEYAHHVGLRLVNVDRDRMDLRLRGEVDQDQLADRGYGGVEIQRSYFLGFPDTGPVSVYAVSALGVTAHDLETLDAQGKVAF